jgi:ribosomal protein S27AE
MPSHRSPDARRAYHRDYMRRRYAADAAFREKQKARSAVGHAIRDGRLDRESCEQCGEPIAEAHHEDYAKSTDVRWLCRDCHELEHGGPGCHK